MFRQLNNVRGDARYEEFGNYSSRLASRQVDALITRGVPRQRGRVNSLSGHMALFTLYVQCTPRLRTRTLSADSHMIRFGCFRHLCSASFASNDIIFRTTFSLATLIFN